MKLAERIVRATRAVRRTRFSDPDFTIVSNNCWGAHVYQQAGLAFRTPFIGLFMKGEDYLSALSDLETFFAAPLRFHADPSRTYPAATAAGAMIHFLHYRDAAEAEAAWRRRVARATRRPERIFAKFCDSDASPEQAARFDGLPLPNKVYFTVDRTCSLRSAVCIPRRTQPNGLRLSRMSARWFDTRRWIETGDGRPRPWDQLRTV